MEELTSLAGVGRKTANVVLSNIYNVQAIIVDTHVHRITQKMGLTVNTDPTKIEFDVMKIVPRNSWTIFLTRSSRLEGQSAMQKNRNALYASFSHTAGLARKQAELCVNYKEAHIGLYVCFYQTLRYRRY